MKLHDLVRNSGTLKSTPININLKLLLVLITFLLLTACQSIEKAQSDFMNPAQLDQDVDTALQKLYQTTPSSKKLAARAKGILVFPDVLKAGFIGGAQYGTGALRKNNRTVGYYNIVAGSYGLQAGVQSFGYALFFMTDEALSYLDSSDGFEVGMGPSVVVLDEGMAKNMTTTTIQNDVYAFVFGQEGLMAGMGLQGSKISKIDPGN